MKATTMKPGCARWRDGAAAACSLVHAPEFRNWGGGTVTLGPSPCSTAVMRALIGDSFLRADRTIGRSLSFRRESPPRTKECSPAPSEPERTAQPRLLARTGAAHAGRPGPE